MATLSPSAASRILRARPFRAGPGPMAAGFEGAFNAFGEGCDAMIGIRSLFQIGPTTGLLARSIPATVSFHQSGPRGRHPGARSARRGPARQESSAGAGGRGSVTYSHGLQSVPGSIFTSRPGIGMIDNLPPALPDGDRRGRRRA